MRRALVVVLGLALLLRVAVVLAQPDLLLAADAGDYDRHARSIAAGDGYPATAIAAPGTPTALRPPAYPALLGAVYALTGDSALAGRLVGALLGTLAVGLLWLVVRRVWGDRPALAAAGLAAVSPPLVLASGALLSEAVFVPLVLALVLVLLRGGPAWLAGALVGVAGLTRVVGLALLVPVVVALWPRGARAVAVAVACAGLVVLPWTVRNTVAFDRVVPVATQEGFNLFGTYNATSRASREVPAPWTFPPANPESRALFGATLDEAEISAELGARARAFALEHPGYVARAAWWNALRLLGVAEQPLGATERLQLGVPERLEGLLGVAGGLTWLGGAAGAVLLLARRRGPRGPLALWLVPVLLALPLVLVLATSRYRLPLDPFLLALAAVALAGRRP